MSVLGCLSMVYKSVFSGDPRHIALRELGSSMEGNLESTCIHWQMALWHLELFTIWKIKTISHNPSVHGAYEVDYWPLFDIVAPEPLCFRSPSAFWCVGVVWVHFLQWHAMYHSCG